MTEIIRRLGVLTGGGTCPGLNAVIRAVVKTASNEYGWEVAGIADGFAGLLPPGKVRLLTAADVRGILPRGGTILGTTNRGNPLQFEEKHHGKSRLRDVSDEVIRFLRHCGIDVLIVIGGDGTLRIAHELSRKGLRVVGVPKTIDNDLQATEVTFGFDTAVNTAMEALDRLHTTAESHHRVIILEVIGRDAGWIALHAGIAGGADVILIPEIPYDLQVIMEKITQRHKDGAHFSIIVVAEGSRPLDGEAAYLEERDLGGMRRLGGIGARLATQLRQAGDVEVRVTVLGHLQRGGSPSAFDRLLATRFGAIAVHLVAQGKIGHMVALQGNQIVSVPLAEAVAQQKIVRLDHDIVKTALSVGIVLGNRRQAIDTMLTQTPLRHT